MRWRDCDRMMITSIRNTLERWMVMVLAMERMGSVGVQWDQCVLLCGCVRGHERVNASVQVWCPLPCCANLPVLPASLALSW